MAAIDLCTIEDVKEQIQLPDNVVNLDALIPTYITDASRAIMNYTKREFRTEVTNPATRRFKVSGYRVDFSPWDLQANAGPYTVTLHPETNQPYTLNDGSAPTYAFPEYAFQPINPQRGLYTSLQFSGFLVIISTTLMAFNYALVDITGTWGWPSVPEDVNRACVLTVGSWITRSAPGASSTWGIPTTSSMPAMPRNVDWHIPWAAKKLLGEYRRGSARWYFT